MSSSGGGGSRRASRYQDPEPENTLDGGSKRRRLKPLRFDFYDLDNEEQRLIQQAIKNSQKETKRVKMEIPEAPTFHPTVDEFKNPLAYISKIRPIAEQYGICKIVPPAAWKPPCQISMSNPKKFPTRLQEVHTLQEGQGFDDGKMYTIAEYKEMADAFESSWCEQHYGGKKGTMTHQVLANDYWDVVEVAARKVEVEYGNDLDVTEHGSGFPFSPPNGNGDFSDEGNSAAGGEKAEQDAVNFDEDDESQYGLFSDFYYSKTGWNLTQLPRCRGSVLKYLRTPVNGVNVPWLYIGMLFTSFCWHNEDNYLYSINYSHFGNVKQWYGVPGKEAKKFEKVSKDFLLESFRESPDLLHHMTTQISPSLLQAQGVPVYKASQDAHTFIITFPKAFHCGFSYGFNVGEAVNFATPEWLIAGGEAEERYRSLSRLSVFSHHRLLFTILHHLNDWKTNDVSSMLKRDLAYEVMRIIDEELSWRPTILAQGIRDIASKVKMPTNDFSTIDKTAAEYDDLRNCLACKHTCVFSAVACECDRQKVTCVRHFHLLCKCPSQKKYLLSWASSDELRQTRQSAYAMLNEEQRTSYKAERETSGRSGGAGEAGMGATSSPAKHKRPSPPHPPKFAREESAKIESEVQQSGVKKEESESVAVVFHIGESDGSSLSSAL